ncbi:M12 family metallo-peptidase [Shewanella sp. A25]|nr:M12 family metallo-peptidase [Shewanella shenzhenensis]
MCIHRSLRLLKIKLVPLFFALLIGNVFAQEVDVFKPIKLEQSADMPPLQLKRFDQIKLRPTTVSVNLVNVDANALKADSVRLSLSEAKSLTFTKNSIETRSANDFTWFGSIAGIAGEATIVNHGGHLTGTIRDGLDLYRIESLGEGVHAIIKVDASKFPPDHAPDFQEIEKKSQTKPNANTQSDLSSNELKPANTGANDRLLADVLTRIDVLVAYTPAAKAEVTDMLAIIQLAVAESNRSYQISGVRIRLNLVDSFEVSYSEGSNSYARMVDDFANMNLVKTRRDNSGADIAVMIVKQPDYCGRAMDIKANASTAFAVVNYSCATGYYSFAHEIGHLQGARHDPDTDGSTSPYPYGHGFRHTSLPPSWRTIMAYNCASYCPRLQYWSNPNVSYNGIATGTSSTSDNARVLNGTASTVAAFRSPPVTSTVGSIWQYTGTPCSGNACPGWKKLDHNAASVRIASGGNSLYQLHNSGRIWQYTGTACSGTSCPGWRMLDNNPATIGIVSDGTQLYQLHNGGRIWQYTGTACSGNSCPGWRMLDNNPATIAIIADSGKLYQLHNTGRIWRYTGTACSGNSCPGWQMLDNNPATVSITAGGGKLYQLHNSGKVWRFTGTACSGNSCPGWQMLDNNPATIGIVAGTQLYQLHNSGKVWKSTGSACSGNSCPGWQMFDNNPATIAIYADGNQLYQLHNTGKVWKSTGSACSGNSCPGWQMLDNNPSTGRVSAAGGKLYQLHGTRRAMTRTRSCYDCR